MDSMLNQHVDNKKTFFGGYIHLPLRHADLTISLVFKKPLDVTPAPSLYTNLSNNTNLLYEQLLAHGDALVEPLLVFLQEFLLFINLSSQVTISLLKGARETNMSLYIYYTQNTKQVRSTEVELTLSRSSIRPSFFSRSRLLLLSRAASFRPVSSVYKRQTY